MSAGGLRTGRRKSGILLHPTSLPGRFGVGDLGAAAFRFADFLAAAGQRCWQMLPLVPTGYGDSPYQGLCSFAGNPILVSLDQLQRDGWLTEAELAGAPVFPDATVAYERVAPWKRSVLRLASERFHATASPEQTRELEDFRSRSAAWLEDFALFLALKDRHLGVAWTDWKPPLAQRDPAALAAARAELKGEIHAHMFAQFAFDRQWTGLRRYCRAKGIELMGDLPIYVAHDSVEVWSHQELFQLDGRGLPLAVAGVPPDYFSATGQLWGNPLYRWDALQQDGFRFWIERIRAALASFDILRLDHFRGFQGYWEVAAGEPTAARGRWVEAPGGRLFEALHEGLGRLPLVAENLGVITPAVEELRVRFGFPGMSILQFAFGTDPQAPTFLPHNYARDLVAYTGTHDNDTVLGWWTAEGTAGSTRSDEDVRRERAAACRYLATDGREMNWAFIRAVLASVADTAMVPLQDVLGLGSEARMNRPSVASGNWRWRCTAPASQLARLAERLAELTTLYGRS